MTQTTKRPRRLTRAESFLGFHFDFHATTDNQPIGGRSFRSDLARMLREAKPDYVQCDCKGHPGVSSYPTKAGNPAPKFAGDALADVTFCVDIHSVDPKEDKGLHTGGIKTKPYQIPLRALIAKDVEGLLLAGRCISGDFFAHASYRVTGNAVATGEAAGRHAARMVLSTR